MQSAAKSPTEYIKSLSAERKLAIEGLKKVIVKNIPKGFKEVTQEFKKQNTTKLDMGKSCIRF